MTKEPCRQCDADLTAILQGELKSEPPPERKVVAQYFAVEGFCSPRCALEHLLNTGIESAHDKRQLVINMRCTVEFAERCRDFLIQIRPRGYPRKRI